MKRRSELLIRKLFSFLLASSLLSGMVLAQVSTGDITGRVVDVQGNAVVGATVTAKNNATGLTRTTTTNDAGEYTLA